ncbi:AsnC-type helix-turn-helix domain protein [Acididesulfobacillus acetoxydans]|uniref:AsnC protein n=1 Tax=Acididesulfobacillus acetoxydans TaxID=1561005 RepID=A0A8S0WGX5_9FIRM|nr:Lrp/AsnC family transcriptional regulator [Acididesulfobacillus acetoxydans]CAA7602282.1 AsnC-type helix-turn-helix domain protein [Acididesulfobacillus acetoxydans]CEJ07500.1 AsnC protein [Acididesulfobacillus acetoxydans]
MLSEPDRRLLKLLEQDCRLTPQELSIQTGLSVEHITTRIHEWEKEKVIVQYRPLINWDRTGDEKVSALIDVKVLPQRGFGFDKIARRLQKFAEIKAVYLISGGYDLSLLIEGRTMQEVALFVAEKLAPLEHIQSTATHFVLRRYKQDGVELTGGDETPQRLMVSP